jgi:hypothetical protein
MIMMVGVDSRREKKMYARMNEDVFVKIIEKKM